MAHVSGNQAWLDLPNKTTPLNAQALENIEATLDRLDGKTLAWGDVTDKPATYPPSGHAGSHASDGSDPISATSIGAEPTIQDSGWRDITADLRAGWTAERFDIRRTGNQVYLRIVNLRSDGSSSSVIWIAIPGFAVPNHYFVQAHYNSGVTPATNLGVIGTEANLGSVRFLRSNPSLLTEGGNAALSWPTDDAWPATLPGVPA